MSDKQKITVYISEALHRQFKIRSAVDGETMSSMAKEALETFIKDDSYETQLQETDVPSENNAVAKVTLYLPNALGKQLETKSNQSDMPVSKLASLALSQYLSTSVVHINTHGSDSNETDVQKKGAQIDRNPESIEISINAPAETSPEKLREIIRKAALNADSVHRAIGGQGLQIDLVEVYERTGTPEGLRR